jgi:hypothetical protein
VQFDWLTEQWPLTPEQQAAQPRSNRPLSASASHAELLAQAAVAKAAAVGAADVRRARSKLNDQTLNRMMANLTPRRNEAAKTSTISATPALLVLRPSSAHQFARPPSAKIFAVNAFSHSSQRYLDAHATRSDVPSKPPTTANEKSGGTLRVHEDGRRGK